MSFDTLTVTGDQEDLSDEQIESLLREAGLRLREKEAARLAASRAASATAFKLPNLVPGDLASPQIKTDSKIARLNPSVLVEAKERELAVQGRKVEDPIVVKKRMADERKATTGPKWFNMPRTDLTPELKRDLQLLKMRGVLDPKRHYKKDNGKAQAPEYSQVGTIIEGSTEFFSARINNRDRKRTFVEEVLASEAGSGRFKRKYEEVQAEKRSGKKGHYKALQAKRRSKR